MEAGDCGFHGGTLLDEERGHLCEDDGVENRAEPNGEES